jgi:hypothetical protein
MNIKQTITIMIMILSCCTSQLLLSGYHHSSKIYSNKTGNLLCITAKGRVQFIKDN